MPDLLKATPGTPLLRFNGPTEAGRSSRTTSSKVRPTMSPTKGIVEWTWFVVPGGFTKDTWVTSIEVLPSQMAVTHHVCLSYIKHTPDVPYFTAMLPRGVIQRDAKGNEVRSAVGTQGGAPGGAQG